MASALFGSASPQGVTAASWEALSSRNWAAAVRMSPHLPFPPEFTRSLEPVPAGRPSHAWAVGEELPAALASALGPVVLARVSSQLSGEDLVRALGTVSGPPFPSRAVLAQVESWGPSDPWSAVHAAALLESLYRALPDGLSQEVRQSLLLPSALGRCLDVHAVFAPALDPVERPASAASTIWVVAPDGIPFPGEVRDLLAVRALLGTLSGFLSLGAVASATRLAAALASSGVTEPVVRSTLTWSLAFPRQAGLAARDQVAVSALVESLPR